MLRSTYLWDFVDTNSHTSTDYREYIYIYAECRTSDAHWLVVRKCLLFDAFYNTPHGYVLLAVQHHFISMLYGV